MKYILYTLLLTCTIKLCNAQKVQSIEFNLYTDSLKKNNIHNYINVDAKLTNGRYAPLANNKQIVLSSSYGKWEGNYLIIDNDYKKDSVVVTAVLLEDKTVTKSVTIYIKKSVFEGKVKTAAELAEELDRPRKKK